MFVVQIRLIQISYGAIHPLQVKSLNDKGAREFKKLISFPSFHDWLGLQRAPFFNFIKFSNMQTKKRENRAKRVRTATIKLPIANSHGIPVFSDFLAEVQRRFDVEKNIKNNLYAFIIQQGLMDEYTKYQASHDMTSPDGHNRAVASLALNVLPEFTN